MPKLIKIVRSDKPTKKYDAFFELDTGKTKKVSFGAIKPNGEAYSDFIHHKDEDRKKRYLQRHSNESYRDPMTPASLAKFILWNKPTLSASIADYKRHFGI